MAIINPPFEGTPLAALVEGAQEAPLNVLPNTKVFVTINGLEYQTTVGRLLDQKAVPEQITQHGQLSGLELDHHQQYLNAERADATDGFIRKAAVGAPGGLAQLDGGALIPAASVRPLPGDFNIPFAARSLATLLGVGQAPFVNFMSDSGRFAGQIDPMAQTFTGGFVANNWFNVFNGASAFISAGKFINNNTTNGGAGGELTQDVQDLLVAMGRSGNRYGVEFFVAETTAGTGTLIERAGKYLLSTNGSKAIHGIATLAVWAFWVRIKTGGSIVIAKPGGGWFFRNGVEAAGAETTLTPADGWQHIEVIAPAGAGYNNSIPFIYANSGDVVQLALPAVTTGRTRLGVHSLPVPTIGATGGGTGGGDMFKSIYDANNNNIVDAAESVPWGGVQNPPNFSLAGHAHDDRYNRIDLLAGTGGSNGRVLRILSGGGYGHAANADTAEQLGLLVMRDGGGTVRPPGSVITGLTDRTRAAHYWLADDGFLTAAPPEPSSAVRQVYVGVGLSATELLFSPRAPIGLV